MHAWQTCRHDDSDTIPALDGPFTTQRPLRTFAGEVYPATTVGGDEYLPPGAYVEGIIPIRMKDRRRKEPSNANHAPGACCGSKSLGCRARFAFPRPQCICDTRRCPKRCICPAAEGVCGSPRKRSMGRGAGGLGPETMVDLRMRCRDGEEVLGQGLAADRSWLVRHATGSTEVVRR